MDDTNFIEAVAERDIDLLLLEEFHRSSDFRRWFADKILDNANDEGFVGAWHSVTHPRLGESDLILLLDSDQRRTAILIENKIDAVVQPDQAERYRQRGQEGVTEGHWDDFRTCMVAPQRYLDSTADARLYDASISYEEIRDWNAESNADPERSRYKARMLTEAIEQNRRGYQPTPHEAVTEFWLRYYRLVQLEYPQLEIRKPGIKPVASDWPEFLNKELGQGRRIVHKWRHECVDLEIRSAGERVDELTGTYALVLPQDADIVRTGGSASIRFRSPAVDRFGDFDAQVGAIRAGLDRAVRLLDLSADLPVETEGS